MIYDWVLARAFLMFCHLPVALHIPHRRVVCLLISSMVRFPFLAYQKSDIHWQASMKNLLRRYYMFFPLSHSILIIRYTESH